MEDTQLRVAHGLTLDHLAWRLDAASREVAAIRAIIERSPHLTSTSAARLIAARRLELATTLIVSSLETIAPEESP